MQPGLNGWFFQGERNHLAYREAKKWGDLCHEGDVSSCMIRSAGGFRRFKRVIPMPGLSRVKALIFMGD
jgi:hypothetical protein